MCTCIAYLDQDFYFGRNLDLDSSFSEQVVITPRNYLFHFHTKGELPNHYAMIGMATVLHGYPLYAEAANEKGLCMAGLNFPGNAVYQEYCEGKDNITPFELIPWILGQCASVAEAEKLLETIHLVNIPFRPDVPLAPLHWMLSDAKKSIVLEPMETGLRLYDNPIGVLTNNPPFAYHQTNLANYMNLTAQYPECRFAQAVPLTPYGQGMGALGLPGDSSPASRFVQASFLKTNSACPPGELPHVSQFFHILDAVGMVRGSVVTQQGSYDITTYSCCINASKAIYYYKTYENSQLTAVKLFREDLDSRKIIRYPLRDTQQIHYENG